MGRVRRGGAAARVPADAPFRWRELRAFIDQVRREFGVPYPLADQRPSRAGRNCFRAQDAAGLDADLCLVAFVRGQYVLTPAADAFYQRVTWEGDTAAAWRPHDDPQSPVLMRPGMRAGRPAVKGISTEILWEQEQAGEAVSEIAADFGLTEEDVRYAIAYELQPGPRRMSERRSRPASTTTSMLTCSASRRSSSS